MQTHTINRWLGISDSVGIITPEEHEKGVKRLLEHDKKIREKVMAVSFSPVLDNQTGIMEEYVCEDYIRATKMQY